MQNTAVKSEALVESRSLRDQYVHNTEALEKVKLLSMLPDNQHVTVEMAANYYEVDKEVIKKVVYRHNAELRTDGLRTVEGDSLRDIKSLCQIENRAKSLTLIPRRALLRIGMLLRDSEVARAVRDYLLNTEDAVRKENELLVTLVKMMVKQNVTLIGQVGKLVEATTDLVQYLKASWPVNPPEQEVQEPSKFEWKFYKRTALAHMLDLYNPKTNEPDPMAATCVLARIYVSPDEEKQEPGFKNGKKFTNKTYRQTVVSRMRRWLKDNNFPAEMTHPKTGKIIRIQYGKNRKKDIA